MTRVCCFCERWESGGIESFLTNVLTRLDPTEFEVDVVAASIKPGVFEDKLRSHGVNFIELSGSRNSIFKNRSRFLELLRARGYDAVHVNAFHAGSLYYLGLAKQAGVPIRIAHSHNAGLRKGSLYGVKILVHRLSRALFSGCATDLWACSQTAAEFLFGGRSGSSCTIANAIEVSRFRFGVSARDEIRAKFGLTDAYVIGHVGRLCYQKNQSFLLDVLAEAIKRRPDSKLLLVGEGEDEQMLREKVRRLGIAGSVIFHGTTDRVERLLCAMDVFAFPSVFEGLGIVAVEAQASGLPVICSGRVPHEAHILPSTRVLPLDSAAEWASALCDYNTDIASRADAPEAVRASGYDITDTARLIASAYQRKQQMVSVKR